MITFITGTPGSGKTLYAVNLIFQWVKEGRKVYADIDGLNIEGVEPAPDDWRTTPEGSIIVYDEAQQRDLFKKTRGTLSDNPIVKDMEVHRHTGHDIVFITQSPIFMHTHIRELVGNHYHLHRPYGAKLASIYFWRLCQNNPNTKTAKSLAESNTLFTYKKELFNFYKSATVHTHSLKIPKKLIIMGLIVVIAPILLYFAAHNSRYLNPNKAKELPVQQVAQTSQTQPTTSQPENNSQPKLLDDLSTKLELQRQQEIYSHNQQLIRYDPILHVSGVIIFNGECKAYNHYSEQINLTPQQCKQAFKNVTRIRETQDSSNQLINSPIQNQPQETQQAPTQIQPQSTPRYVVVGDQTKEIAEKNKNADTAWSALDKK